MRKSVSRFRTSPCLERYTKVKEWDNGYLVVMEKYSNNKDDIEEYIDLVPIIQNKGILNDHEVRIIQSFICICYEEPYHK